MRGEKVRVKEMRKCEREEEVWLGASSEADGGSQSSLGGETERRDLRDGLAPKGTRANANCVVNCGTRVASRPVAW